MSTKPEYQGEAGTRAEGMGEGMGEDVRERAQQLREELSRLGQSAKDVAYDQFEERTRQLEDVIQEQPLRSVMIAAGVGFVLGVMWSRD